MVARGRGGGGLGEEALPVCGAEMEEEGTHSRGPGGILALPPCSPFLRLFEALRHLQEAE